MLILNFAFIYFLPHAFIHYQSSRVSTLSLLETRLRRIETLLESNIPQLVEIIKKSSITPSKRINQKPSRKRHTKSYSATHDDDHNTISHFDRFSAAPSIASTDSESISDFDCSDSSSLQSNDHDSDNDNDHDLDFNSNSNSDLGLASHPKVYIKSEHSDSGPNILNHSHSFPHNSSSSTLSDSKRKVKSLPNSYSNDDQHTSVDVQWDIPKAADRPHVLYLDHPSTNMNKKIKDDTNLAAITVHNGFTQIFIECAPLKLCSPKGFEWISTRFNNPSLPGILSKKFNVVHEQMKEGILSLTNASATPVEFDKKIVFPAIEAYFKCFTGCLVFSFTEIDNIIFKEFGERLPFDGSKYEVPENELKDPFGRSPADFVSSRSNNTFTELCDGKTITGLNGYAEKLAIASITAIGAFFLCHRKDESIPTYINYETTTKYVATAKYYVEKYSFIANSVTGVKGMALLLFLFSSCINLKPAVTLSAIAIRLAQESGLHREEAYTNVPIRESILRVNTWWLLYCSEADICIKLCRNSCLHDRDISTPLPLSFPFIDESGVIVQDRSNLLAFLVHFYRIWHRINSELLSPNANLTIKEQLVKHVTFQNDIETWKNVLPSELRPNYSDSSSFLEVKPQSSINNLAFYHLLSYCHITYYSVVATLYRSIGGHPSWIYRFTSGSDESVPNSTNNTPNNTTSTTNDDDRYKTSSSENQSDGSSLHKKQASKATQKTTSSASDMESGVQVGDLKDYDPATVVALLKEASDCHAKGKMRRTFSRNGVKLIVRRIALENPEMLRANEICVLASCRTIEIIENVSSWFNASIWQLSYFGFSSFINLFVSCMFLPLHTDCVNRLSYMYELIGVFEKLYHTTKPFMFQAEVGTMLREMVDSLTSYTEQKRKDAKMKDYKIPKFTGRRRREDDKNAGQSNSEPQNDNTESNNTGLPLGNSFSSSLPTSFPPSSKNLVVQPSVDQPGYRMLDSLGIPLYQNQGLPTTQEFSSIPAHQLSEYISQPPKNGTQPTVVASSSPAISRNNPSAGKDARPYPLLDQFQKPTFQNSSGLGVSSFADDIFDVTDAQASSPPARPGSSIYGISNMNAMQNGNMNGRVDSISNVSGADSNMYNTLGNRSSSISMSNNNHSLHNGNDEPMLDYLYPDFGLGSDSAVFNSLFFMSGPSWPNSEFTVSTNLQGDLGFGNGNNNM